MRRLAAITAGSCLAIALTAGPAAAASWGGTTNWGGTTSAHKGTFGTKSAAGSVSNTALTTTYSTDGDVYTSLQHNGVIYLGGRFTHITSGGTTIAAQHIAALSVRTGQPVAGFSATADDGDVLSLAMTQDGSKLIVGGRFTVSGGQNAFHIMELDLATGARDASWHGSTTFPVHAITVTPTQVIAGGGPDHVVVGATPTYLVSLNVSGGAATSGWTAPRIDNEPYHSVKDSHGNALAAMTDGWITALTQSTDGQRIYVGGYFNRVVNSTRPSLVALSTATGGVITSFAPLSLRAGTGHTGMDVLSLLVTNKRIYAAVGGTLNVLFSWDVWKGGTPLFVDRADGDYQTIALIGNKLYAGGHFHDFVADAKGFHYNNMKYNGSVVDITFQARFDPTTGILDSTWHPAMGNWQDPGAYFGTYTMSTDGHYLFTGGAFDQVNGHPRAHIAFFPGP